MLTRRRAVEWTIAIGVLALLAFVPLLRDHHTPILTSYLAVLTMIGLIRGKPQGIRVLVLSILVSLLATALAVLAFWVNVWLGLVFIVSVPTTALIVAARRDQSASVA